MECHRCQRRAEVEAGKYAKLPFSETPCATCELKENSDYTMEYIEDRESRIQNPESRIEDEDDLLPVSVMREVVMEILRLPPEIRDVVCWRFAGMSYRDIAALQGITVAGAEVRLWRAMKKWPALTALFAQKAAKQSRRKPTASRSQNSESRINERKHIERRMGCEKRDR